MTDDLTPAPPHLGHEWLALTVDERRDVLAWVATQLSTPTSQTAGT